MPLSVRLGGQGSLGQHLAAEPGRGLQLVVGVDQVGVAQPPGTHVAHQGGEHVGVDGGPQYPGPSFLLPLHGDDEVREVAEPHEHVADVQPLEHDLVEPRLILVVDRLEVERAAVGLVLAVLADDADVHEGARPLVDGPEDRVQAVLVGHLVKGVHVRQHLELGHPLVEEHVDGVALVPDHEPEVAGQLFLVCLLEFGVQDVAQGEQGDQGQAQGGQDQVPFEPDVGWGGHGSGLVVSGSAATSSRMAAMSASNFSRYRRSAPGSAMATSICRVCMSR